MATADAWARVPRVQPAVAGEVAFHPTPPAREGRAWDGGMARHGTMREEATLLDGYVRHTLSPCHAPPALPRVHVIGVLQTPLTLGMTVDGRDGAVVGTDGTRLEAWIAEATALRAGVPTQRGGVAVEVTTGMPTSTAAAAVLKAQRAFDRHRGGDQLRAPGAILPFGAFQSRWHGLLAGVGDQRHHRDVMNVLEEVKGAYEEALRTAIVRYVWQDPDQRRRLHVIPRVPPWRGWRPASVIAPSTTTVVASRWRPVSPRAAPAKWDLLHAGTPTSHRLRVHVGGDAVRQAALLPASEPLPAAAAPTPPTPEASGRVQVDDMLLLFVLAGLVPTGWPAATGGGSGALTLHPAPTLLLPLHNDKQPPAPASEPDDDDGWSADEEGRCSYHVVSVMWPSARQRLQPVHPPPLLHDRAEAGITVGTVTATAAALVCTLGLTSAACQRMWQDWHALQLARGALVHPDAAAMPATPGSPPIQPPSPSPARMHAVGSPAAGKGTLTPRVPSSHLSPRHGHAPGPRARPLSARITATTPALPTGGRETSALPPAAVEKPDLEAIAAGGGPFALPPSIRHQLQGDPRLRKFMADSLRDYVTHLQRHRQLVHAVNAVSRPVEEITVGRDPMAREGMAAHLPPILPFPADADASNLPSWMLPSSLTAVLSTPSSQPPPLMVPLSPPPSPPPLPRTISHRPTTPAAAGGGGDGALTPLPLWLSSERVGWTSRPTTPVAHRPSSAHTHLRLLAGGRRPTSSGAPSPPRSRLPTAPPSPPSHQRDHVLASTQWYLTHAKGMQPTPDSINPHSAPEAGTQLDRTSPPSSTSCAYDAVEAAINAGMSAQLREGTLRSLAQVVAAFLRYAPRCGRTVVDALVQEHAAKEQSAATAHSAAGASVEAKMAAAEAEAAERARQVAEVEAAKRAYEERKVKEGPIIRGPIASDEAAMALTARTAGTGRPGSPPSTSRRDTSPSLPLPGGTHMDAMSGRSSRGDGRPMPSSRPPMILSAVGDDSGAGSSRGGGSGSGARPVPPTRRLSAVAARPAGIPYTIPALRTGLGLHVAGLVLDWMASQGWLTVGAEWDGPLPPPPANSPASPAFVVTLQPNPAFGHRAITVLHDFMAEEMTTRTARSTHSGTSGGGSTTTRPSSGPSFTSHFPTPMVYARTLRRLRYRLATGGVSGAGSMSCSQYYGWRARAAELSRGEGVVGHGAGGIAGKPVPAPSPALMQAVAAVSDLIPFHCTPSLAEVEEQVDAMLKGVVSASRDVPTPAYRRSEEWTRLHQPRPSATTATSPAMTPTSTLPLPIPVPIAQEHDVLDPPAMETWLMTGKAPAKWTTRRQYLMGVGLDEPAVAFARALVLQVVRENVHDAERVLDLFEPFAYLLTEPDRLDALLAADAVHNGDGTGQGSGGGGMGVMEGGFDALIPPDPAIPVQDCGRLIRQYEASIYALERSVAGVTGAHVASGTSGRRPEGVATSRIMARRGSEGYTTKQLDSVQVVLPRSVDCDLVRVDCGTLVHHLLTLAHACIGRIATYLDARCLRTFRGLSASYTHMMAELQRPATTPDTLVKGDEAFDRSTMRLMPILHSVTQVAVEELDFLLRVDLPKAQVRVASAGGHSLPVPSQDGSDGGDVVGLVECEAGPEAAVGDDAEADATANQHERSEPDDGPIVVSLKTAQMSTLERAGLAGSDRIGGASVETLQAASEVRAWQRALPDVLTKVSRRHVEARSRLEQSARVRRGQAEEMVLRAADAIDRARAGMDTAFPTVVHQNGSLRALAPGLKSCMDGLTEACDLVLTAKSTMMEVGRDEAVMRMPVSPTVKAVSAYATRLAGGGHNAPLPWGGSVDLLNTPPTTLVAEIVWAAAQPFITLVVTARNMVTRVDRWLHAPVFSHDRDDVRGKMGEMEEVVEGLTPLLQRPIPSLHAFLLTAAKGGPAILPLSLGSPHGKPPSRASMAPAPAAQGVALPDDDATPAATGATADGDGRSVSSAVLAPAEADAREHAAAVYGMLKDEFVVDAIALSYVKALAQRLAHFRQRYLPLLSVLTNPNLTPAHWDRINAIVGSRIGPPTTKQRGFFGSGGGGGITTPASAWPSPPRGSGVGALPLASGSEGGRAITPAPPQGRRISIGSVTHMAPLAPVASDDGNQAVGAPGNSTASMAPSPAAGGDVGDHVGIHDDGDDDGEGEEEDGQGGEGGERAGGEGDVAGGDDVEVGSQPAWTQGGGAPAAGSSIATMATILSPVSMLATTTAAAVRGPSLVSLIEMYNLDERVADLVAISDDADRAAAGGE